MSGARSLFDTSVYIPYLRGEAYGDLIRRAVRSGQVILSSVVLAELYAGTRSPRDKADLDVIFRAYESLDLLVVPSGDDWTRAGQVIRRHGSVYGEIVPRDHLNDVLILISGARAGAEVVTENVKHFSRWATLFRRMGIVTRVREVRRDDHLD
jgi:predicted nucleic acid-binding protein